MDPIDFVLRCQHFFFTLPVTRTKRALVKISSQIYDDFLRQSQFWTEAKRSAFQQQKIKQLVKYAYNKIPFYRQWLDGQNIKYGDIVSERELLRIKPITKADLKKSAFTDLISADLPRSRSFKLSTSGSTGEPFTFLSDRMYVPFQKALLRRFVRWCGIDMQSRKILVADKDFIARRPLDLNIEISDLLNDQKRVLQIVKDFHGDILVGYASGLQELADMSIRERTSLHFSKIVSFAEQLSAGSRRIIEEAFGGKVYEFYGATEVGMIAQECPSGDGLHINEESLIVQIDKSATDPSSNYGSIIVTSLTNDVMPFIRYNLGDVGTFVNEPCQCGVTLRKIRVLGRDSTIFEVNKKRVHQFEFNNVMKKFSDYITSFQIAKDPRGGIIVFVVSDNLTKDTEHKIIQALKEEINPAGAFSIFRTSSLQRLRSGKLKYLLAENA